jgi:hypothetical protein
MQIYKKNIKIIINSIKKIDNKIYFLLNIYAYVLQ